MDVAMPLLNGLDAARQLRQLMPKVKVIFLTMNEDPDIAAEAFRVGASAFLLKNSAASELLTAIRGGVPRAVLRHPAGHPGADGQPAAPAGAGRQGG